MSTKTISIAPRETNFYLPNQPAVKHPMEKTLKILACSVDGTKVIRKNRKPNLRLLNIRYKKKTVQNILQTMDHILQNPAVDISYASMKDGTEFLLSLYKKGLGYLAINTARSMLSNILPVKEGIECSKHPIVPRMLKGIFRTRPSLPQYICINNAEIVIEFLKSLPCWEEKSLKWLTLKLVTLLTLLSTHKCQTLSSLSTEHMDINIQQVIFYISKVIKKTTAMFHLIQINLQAFPADETICPVRNIVEYIRASEKLRKSKNVLLSYYKHEPIETQTISRYVKLTLKVAGINTKIFSGHSARHASSIGKFMTGLSLNDIVKKGR